MKRLLLSLAFTIVLALSVSAQQAAVTPYLTVEQMPDLIKCLPAPPAFDSPEFAYDMMRYVWGKQQRLNPERAAIARRDAIWSYEALVNEFVVPFGLEVNREATPEIWKLLETSLTTTDAIRVAPKAHYLRQRPFERYEDKLLTDEEDELRGEGSYPSGHTMRGWMCALLMAEIAPEHADTLFARGWMYGESRVIVGAHWQSDVDASRVAASIGYCALQGSPEFREQMRRAQAEYREKTGQASTPDSRAAHKSHRTARKHRVKRH